MSATGRQATRWMGALLLALGQPACAAEDTISDVAPVCGDGFRTGNEGCDTNSPGCDQCQVVRGWACTELECHVACGDGIVTAPETCDPPDGDQCRADCSLAGSKAEACNMTGWWIGRQMDFAVATIGQALVQTSSNWHLWQIEQTGDDFVIKQYIACGIKVTGSVIVNLDDRGVKGLMWINPQDGREYGGKTRPARTGTFKVVGDHCELSMSRMYLLRGGDPSLLPDDFSTKPEFSALPPMPSETDPANPTRLNWTGQADIDGDQHPGLTWYISGLLSGSRHTVQRDWHEYAPRDSYPVPQHATEFASGEYYNNEEAMLEVSNCGSACGLVTTPSTPSAELQHRTVFRYLGATLADPGVAAIIQKPLLQSKDDDYETCMRVQAALPHDPAKE